MATGAGTGGIRNETQSAGRDGRRARWAAAVVVLFAAATASAFQEDSRPAPAGRGEVLPEPLAAPAGLSGLLPEQVPNGLTLEDFSVLGPNWESWNEKTAESLLKLYESEYPLDVAAQKATLSDLEHRLRVMRKAMTDSNYAVIRDHLITLNGRLTRRVELGRAILATLESDPGARRAAAVAAARPGVLGAASSLESTLRAIDGGSAWLPWVRADEIRALLRDDTQTEAAVAVLAAVSEKLKGRSQLEAAQQQFLNRPAFLSFEAAVNRYLGAAAPVPADYVANLRTQLAALVEAVEKYEDQNLGGDASALKNALALVRHTAADHGDAIELVARTHYLNYNMQALVSEDLMARLVSDSKCEFSPVRDYGLGAHIRGWQSTQSHASFDLKPSGDGANFEIKAHGTTYSNTTGSTDQATVRSIGNHQWHATKTGHFDGVDFSAAPAQVAVNPSTRPVAAATKYDWIPILGSIANDMAMDEARRRTPQARAFAAQRMMQRIGPQMDEQVNQSLADASHDIRSDLLVRLRNAGLYSPTTKILSTEDWMRVSSRVGTSDEPAGASPEEVIPPGKGITAHAHESLFNNVANRWNFHGRTMTEKQVREELGAYFTQLMGKKVDTMEGYDPNAEGPNIFDFDPKDPVRFQLENGAVFLIIRAGFRGGSEDVPPQVVRVELRPKLEGANIVMERGQVSVAPVDPGAGVARQVIRAGIIRKKIESSFPNRTHTRRIDLERKDKPSVTLWVMRIKSLNGWMTVWAE